MGTAAVLRETTAGGHCSCGLSQGRTAAGGRELICCALSVTQVQKHGSKAERQATSEAAAFSLVAEPQGRANSFVGTEEYLAPEIINGIGHGPSVDWCRRARPPPHPPPPGVAAGRMHAVTMLVLLVSMLLVAIAHTGRSIASRAVWFCQLVFLDTDSVEATLHDWRGTI